MDTSALDKYIGQPVEVEDASALDQCMDLAFLWCDIIGIPRSAIRNGYAYQVWGNHDPNYLDVVSGPPQPGDFVIWGTQVGFAGHIAVVKSGNFTSYDQNWNYIQKVEVVPHTYYGVLGFLRPKINQGGKEMPLTPNQQDKFLKMGLHREPRADELNNQEWANNPGLLADTLWGNGGSDFYAQEQQPNPLQAQLDDLTATVAQLNDLNQSLKTQVLQDQDKIAQLQTPTTPVPQPPVAPAPPDNSLTITKDGLWDKIKAFFGIK